MTFILAGHDKGALKSGQETKNQYGAHIAIRSDNTDAVQLQNIFTTGTVRIHRVCARHDGDNA